MKKCSYKQAWYLMESSLPDLNWARLRVFESGKAEVFDCDGRTTRFATEEEAKWWLLEDEFRSLDKFDDEDEAEYGVQFSKLSPPDADSDEDLKRRMLVRAREA